MTTLLTGGCLCGAIRYEAAAEETLPYICHCTDCQRYGGGPFHAAIVVAAASLKIAGEPQVWAKTADSGREVARHFCGTCGGHVFTSPWPNVTRYSLKAGALDDPGVFRPAHQIWTNSGVDWVRIESATAQHEAGFAGPVPIG
ncbi:MAG: GFA family protein [Pseudomonadota bacterium]